MFVAGVYYLELIQHKISVKHEDTYMFINIPVGYIYIKYLLGIKNIKC